MTQKQLDEIKARCEAATPGPWDVLRVRVDDVNSDWFLLDRKKRLGIVEGSDANAVFIAHARHDIPDLIAEVERLRALTSWIPCSERMPPVDDCICYEANRLGVTPCIGGEWEATDWNVTHWLPLPGAPEVLDG